MNLKKISLSIICVIVVATTSFSQPVNEKMAAFHKKYEHPKIVKMGSNVHAAFGYDYSNFSWIEGEDGVILVDAGWFPGKVKKALVEFRKICQKPVVALIYTHLHTDHYGGSEVLLDGAGNTIPVFGPHNWNRWVDESFNVMRPMIFEKIFAQMGLILPIGGEDGTYGSGAGPITRPDGVPVFTKPNIIIKEKTSIEIAGVTIELIPTTGDLNENLFIWLPNEKVLFIGDIVAGIFPAIETVRFEKDRNPSDFVESYNLALDLAPDYLVPGHGPMYLGKETVEDVLRANRDVTEFMVDQLDRLYVKGLTADEIIDQLQLPPALAKHPEIQCHYHTLPWMIKQMYFKRAGFAGEPEDLIIHTKSEEAKRLIPLMGGAKKVVSAAEKALKEGDARWAARLASYVLELGENPAAHAIKMKAFKEVARTTLSANERNYMLTYIIKETQGIDFKKMMSADDYTVAKKLDSGLLLKLMKARFAAEKTDHERFAVAIQIIEEDHPHYYQVENNVLFYLDKAPSSIDATLEMKRDVLNQIVANQTTWSKEFAQGNISVGKGRASIEKLVSWIE